MKLTRLCLLLLAVLVTTLFSPGANAGNPQPGRLMAHRSVKPDRLNNGICWDIYCWGSYSGTCCSDVFTCLDVCDGVCSVPSGTCGVAI